MKEIKIEKVNYHGWKNSIQISNSHIELVVVTDVGPRIISVRHKTGKNIFYNDTERLGKTGGSQWFNYGGHRLWHAPESKPRTYSVDNKPVKWEKIEGGIVVISKMEENTRIQKTLEIQLDNDKPIVKVVHRLTNRGEWEIRLAPWAISVLGKGAIAILPMPRRGKHDDYLLPVGSLNIWAYSSLSDTRFKTGNEFVRIIQDVKKETPFKIGMNHENTWGAAVLNETLFIKVIKNYPDKEYPDMGSRIEVFTNPKILELETLGPLELLPPGKSLDHIEYWFIKPLKEKVESELQIKKHIYPYVTELEKRF